MVAEPGDCHDDKREGGAESQTQQKHTEGHQLSHQRNPVHCIERGEGEREREREREREKGGRGCEFY